MTGERNLATLLSSMDPYLLDGEFVFVTFPDGRYGDGEHLNPVTMVMEQEGMTLVIPRELAQQNNIAFDGVFRCISLQVHSSLDAVGLTAAISRQLADAGISANVVAGYFHDHVFVPAAEAQRAVTLLKSTPQ